MSNDMGTQLPGDDVPMYRPLFDPRWRDTYPAACAGDWELFDPRRHGEPDGQYNERAALARKVCHWCPILDTCAEFVQTDLTVRDRQGFTYAGVTYNAAGDPIKNQEAAA